MDQKTPSLVEPARHVDWLPDESLYSLAARHHRISGNLRPERTALQLFGHSRGGYPHDLPGGLDHFVAVTDGRLGDANGIATERTVFPALTLFRSQALVGEVLAAMRSPRIGAIKSQLGLPASRLGGFCPLRGCPDCMAEDLLGFGTPYWHRAHQVPGAFFCLVHERRLLDSALSVSRVHRFDWSLPSSNDVVRQVGRNETPDRAETSYLLRLTRMALDAIQGGAVKIASSPGLAQALWRGMNEAGWIRRNGRIDRAKATGQWLSILRILHASNGGLEGEIHEKSAYSQIHALLSSPARGHVLRPLALAALLFPSWKDFAQASHSPPTGEPSQLTTDPSSEEEAAKMQVHEALAQGRSVSAAAASAGVSVVTAQRWLAENGTNSPKRPSKLTGVALDGVVRDLERGEPLSEIAGRHGLSLSSVHRVLSTTVGLKDCWLNARREGATRAARKEWSHALESAGLAGPKVARTVAPKAYAWLYRNDRPWLMEANAKAKAASVGSSSSVDWDARDEALSQACREAILVLSRGVSGRRLKLNDIIVAVPELRTKMHRIEGLPLTEAVLRSAQIGRKYGRRLLP